MYGVAMMKKLSVIIVSYSNKNVLVDCLNSIEKYNDIGDDLEVIVSDNSPDMDLYNYVSENYGWIRILKNDNIGFGAGNNRGVKVAEGKYLLFLNPDTILVEPIFKFAVSKFESNENLALFGVQLIGKNGDRNASFFSIDKYGLLSAINEKFCKKFNIYKDGKMFICGADMFVRKQSFIEAGYFDENIFMYKEEADLIKRIKISSKAKQTSFYKEKKIVHLEGGTENVGEDKLLRTAKRMTDSDLYYCKKWNLSFKKVMKKRMNYARFKKIIYRLFLKKELALNQKALINYYKLALQNF